MNADQLSSTILIAGLTALLTARGFVLLMLAPVNPYELPSLTKWLVTTRNIGLVGVAVYYKYSTEYFVQWIVTFAAVAAAATGAAALLQAFLTRRASAGEKFLDTAAGALALVFTGAIHGWDPLFLAFTASVVLVPALFAQAITSTIGAGRHPGR